MFIIWHLLAICVVIGLSFTMGFLTGKKHGRRI